MKQYLKNKNFRAGLLITGIMILAILIGLVWTPYDPNAMSGSEKLQGPSGAHLFGTDNFGRDIFSRVIQGAGATFLIAAAAVAIGLIVGLIVGGLTGFYGGVLDEVLMRIADSILAFPSILLAQPSHLTHSSKLQSQSHRTRRQYRKSRCRTRDARTDWPTQQFPNLKQ